MNLPLGYRYAASYAGIRQVRRDELALIVSGLPPTAAAVFTTNRVQAAPVRLARQHLKAAKGLVGAILVNAGNANCANRTGDAVALACCRAAGKLLPYIVVARLRKWVKRAAQRVDQWRELDDDFAVGEFRLRLHGWKLERRFAVVRERIREGRDSLGRKLIEVPGYTFRVFVTSCDHAPEEIWRDYNRRADMENRIAELKHDLGADGFCLREFFATEAAFRAVLLLFNLLAEFQRVAGFAGYRAPATIRLQVLTCGAILGRAGRRLVVHLVRVGVV
ncbi:MAG: bifunctional ornithine acetyltransferase/N-acetylglutamate synthase [Bryobacterales bacterium]|nr:bifunctional ornithine acetyltransferase/N-acetylglutamate synthase [Bryobacterales bacterium]